MNSIETHIRAAAQKWVLLLNSGEATSSDRREFELWLCESNPNRMEYERAEQFWNGLDSASDRVLENFAPELLQSVDQKATFSPPLDRHTKPSLFTRNTGIAIGLVVIVTGVLIAQFSLELGSGESDQSVAVSEFSSEVAQVKPIHLADGSIIELGPKSLVRVEYASNRRNVNLLEGEAFFVVRKDQDRPFVVTSGIGKIQAVGTQFEVRAGVRSVSVRVFEGEVLVFTLDEHDSVPRASLKAGQQVSYPRNGVLGQVRDLDLSIRIGWRTGRMVFEDRPLVEVVADLNRYGDISVTIEDPRLWEVLVNGVFKFGAIDAVLMSIEQTLPADIVWESQNRVRIIYRESNASP